MPGDPIKRNRRTSLTKRSRLRHARAGTRRSPRFADPWSFRHGRPIPEASDLQGRKLSPASFRQGGEWTFRVVDDDADVSQQPERSMLAELRRRVAAEISSYRRSGVCTSDDLELISALWQDGLSLRAYARRVRKTPAAIGAHIERLQNRCHRFYRWWDRKNAIRREACRRRRDRYK
jgi:hypothetical protein